MQQHQAERRRLHRNRRGAAARAFDIVVDIKNDKSQNREAAIALAKQVLARR